ncbi:hypothetical protein NCS52_00304500 [Fusarium sp. LHS14.1]|nr:hypothetical protein NCS52_00304500 [Fusarium sp. LHS14.1]
MTSFGPIAPHLLNQPLRFPNSRYPPEEGNRWVRHSLRDINEKSSFHDRQYSWGFTIFRTIYTPESDEAFPKAIEALHHFANNYATEELSVKPLMNKDPLDPAPNEELARRFYCDIVEDAKDLDGASPDDVAKRFDIWVQEHLQPEGQNHMKMGRFCFCIMLDQQGIDHLLDLRTGEASRGSYRNKLKPYVKVVTEAANWNEEGGERFWLKVGIKGHLFGLAFGWPEDLDISELGNPDPTDGIHNMYGMYPFDS